jgi:hypothetical protein
MLDVFSAGGGLGLSTVSGAGCNPAEPLRDTQDDDQQHAGAQEKRRLQQELDPP